MCLASPMRLAAVSDSGRGVAELEGAKYDVDLTLTPDAQPGDFVIVHAGFAIEQLDKEEAEERLELFAEMAKMYASEGDTG